MAATVKYFFFDGDAADRVAKTTDSSLKAFAMGQGASQTQPVARTLGAIGRIVQSKWHSHRNLGYLVVVIDDAA